MRVLLANDRTAWSEAILRDLHFAGLPHHSTVRILSVEALRSQASTGVLSAVGAAGTLRTSRIECEGEEQAELEEIRQLVAESAPDWYLDTAHAVGNDPDTAILEAARSFGADLIMIGSHVRTGLHGIILGSIATRVAERADCSVRIVHPRHLHPDMPLRILLPLDGFASSTIVTEALMRRSFPRNTQIHLLHVIEPRSPHHDVHEVDSLDRMFTTTPTLDIKQVHHMLDYFSGEVRERYGWPRSQIRYGEASAEILRCAHEEEIDAIMLGAIGGSPESTESGIGPVAATVARRAETAVEVLRYL